MTFPTVFTAVINSFWQTAALTALVWVAMKFVRMNAATRPAIWWVVLTVLLVLPFVPRPVISWSHPRSVVAAPQLSVPAPYTQPLWTEPPAIVTIPERPADRWPFAVLAVWALVFLYRLARIGQSYVYLCRVKRNGVVSDLQLPDTGRHARVLISDDVVSPMAVGFLPAAVILPVGLPERISGHELDQVLLHESAHIARRDDWWNLLARLMGAVLALHPVAWWILRQNDYEREAACDDWVVARTGAARPYAETLAHMAELRWQRVNSNRREEALASGVFGRGSRIADRIEKLLEAGREVSVPVSRTRVIACCILLCCLAAAGTLAPRWIAFAQSARFEVASIRPAVFASPEYAAGFYQGSAGAGNTLCGAKFSISGTLVSIRRVSICQLIALAYGVPGYQIVGAPELPQTPGGFPDMVQAGIAVVDQHPSFFYDIEARAPGKATPTEDDVLAMLRNLLADRFQLKMHRDSKEMQYDAMVAGKNGIKLNPAKEDCKPASNLPTSKSLVVREMHLCGKSMEDLALAISHDVEIPVADKTAVTGRFDYDLRVQYESLEDSHAAWLEAYRKQLGLVLETRKGPVDILVVDHVEAPSEN